MIIDRMNVNYSNIDRFGIYKIENIITGSLYIGLTTNPFRERWENHYLSLCGNMHSNRLLQVDWRLFGGDNFYFDAVEVMDTKDGIHKRETYWIHKYKRENTFIVYNVHPRSREKELIDYDSLFVPAEVIIRELEKRIYGSMRARNA